MKPFDPKSTVFTNLALDRIMPIVSPNAWKILCYAIRKTAGWTDETTESGRKESDVISISQFREGCGIASNDTVMNAIDECLKNGYLLRFKEGMSFRYCINKNYELPTVTETVTPIVTESVMITVTDSVNTNSNVNYNINTNKQIPLSPAEEKGNTMRSKEEIMKSTEEAYMKGLISEKSDYANYPERLRPVVEKMKLWNFRPPKKSKGGQYGLWVQSCDEILTGCAEFGVNLIDQLHNDWMAYLNTHGGLPPYSVSSPKSLVSAVNGKAALLRGGNNSPFWNLNGKKPNQSRLDV